MFEVSTQCRCFVCAECPSIEISRVVVLDSRSVAGDTINELIVNQTLLLRKRVHLDGQGRLQVVDR
jgi:hypothetical protein